jgi:hypothetical protein
VINLREVAERLDAVEAELAKLQKQTAALAGKVDRPKATKAAGSKRD